MTLFNLGFIVCLNLLLISVPTQAQDTLLCSDQFPTRPEACPEVFEPVCADYPNICAAPPCPGQVKDFPSPCAACQDSNVQSYVIGECPDDGISNEEELNWESEGEEECWTQEDLLEWLKEYADINKIYCDVNPDIVVNCDNTYQPVCGYYEDSEIGTNFPNGCFACYQGMARYFLMGECTQD